jgi:hypothetical protein
LLQQPYKQFVLFGDSITQGSFDQSRGFALGAQLSHGPLSLPFCPSSSRIPLPGIGHIDILTAPQTTHAASTS